MDLIADVGATHTRCALLDSSGTLLAPESFTNNNFETLKDVLDTYIGQRRTTDKLSRAAIAVAAPLDGDTVEMTNRPWRFSGAAIRQDYGLRSVEIVNDFEALAWSLAEIGERDRQQIGPGEPRPGSTMGVIGPGSGLGVASLVPHAEGWTAVGGEGGHVSLPASNEEEARVIEKLRRTFGHCSAERVLSGPGLANLYMVVAELAGHDPLDSTPEDVTSRAQSGERLARQTMTLFFAFLGTVASDLALTVGARGGIYIAGGIVPKFIATLRSSRFRDRFEDKGRRGSYLAAIPTYVITDPFPSLKGLRAVLANR